MKNRVLILAVVIATAMAGPAWADGCDAVAAARIKGDGVPAHQTLTFTMDNTAYTIESISIGNKTYTKHKNGRWKVEAQAPDDGKTPAIWAKQTCTPDGTETIDGDLADIILNNDRAGGFAIETRFWISRSSGLIVKTVMLVNNSQIAVQYDFRDVEPPPVALQVTGD